MPATAKCRPAGRPARGRGPDRDRGPAGGGISGRSRGRRVEPVRDRLVARRGGILATATCGGRRRRPLPLARPACGRIGKLALPDQPERRRRHSCRRRPQDMRRARKALRMRRNAANPSDFHELRKAVKAHCETSVAVEKVLAVAGQAARKARRRAWRKARRPARHLRPARAAQGQATAARRPGQETRLLDRLAKRSERKLPRLALPKRRELFHDRPKRSAKKVDRKIRHDLAELQPAAGP